MTRRVKAYIHQQFLISPPKHGAPSRRAGTRDAATADMDARVTLRTQNQRRRHCALPAFDGNDLWPRGGCVLVHFATQTITIPIGWLG
jgi:hypothetical protein